jgi:hypothetical protein
MRSTSTAVIAAALLASLTSACDDTTEPDPPVDHELVVVAVVDPDLSDPVSPGPARLVWFSTLTGVARFLAGQRELCDRAAVSGGELVTTSIDPLQLIPEINDVEIRLVPQRGGDELFKRVQVYVDAECTWPSHCPGDPDCIDFSCQ